FDADAICEPQHRQAEASAGQPAVDYGIGGELRRYDAGSMGSLTAVRDSPGRQLLRREVTGEACPAPGAAEYDGELRNVCGWFGDDFGRLHGVTITSRI